MNPAASPTENLQVAKIWRTAEIDFEKLRGIYIENRLDKDIRYFFIGDIYGIPASIIMRTESRTSQRRILEPDSPKIKDIFSKFGRVYIRYGADEEKVFPDFDSFCAAIHIH
jgi:hypothetical protein